MYNLLLTFIKRGNDTRCLRLSCGFIIIHVALPRPVSFLVSWVIQWFVVNKDSVSALLSGSSVSSESVNQYFHLRCAGVTALGYFNDTQLLNYTHSAIPRSLDTPPLYCWPVQKHVGEAWKTLQGNPIIIQAALAAECFMRRTRTWLLTTRLWSHVMLKVNSGTDRIGHSTVRWQLSEVGKIFYAACLMRRKPLTKQMLLQGWYTTFTSQATWAVCQMQSASLARARSLPFSVLSVLLSSVGCFNRLLGHSVLLCVTHGSFCP